MKVPQTPTPTPDSHHLSLLPPSSPSSKILIARNALTFKRKASSPALPQPSVSRTPTQIPTATPTANRFAAFSSAEKSDDDSDRESILDMVQDSTAFTTVKARPPPPITLDKASDINAVFGYLRTLQLTPESFITTKARIRNKAISGTLQPCNSPVSLKMPSKVESRLTPKNKNM